MSPLPPFDFTAAMRRLCHDVTLRLEAFSHVRMDEVAVTFAQARRRVSFGLQAKLTPLRFAGGALTTVRRGRVYAIQRWFAGDQEMLYILTFYLPRFLDQSFREKMITVMHELYHISPRFDGDIRRLEGHYHVHSHSQKAYDAAMGKLVDEYLARRPPRELYQFLDFNYRHLVTRYGSVVGIRIPNPKLVPLPKSA
ncbi:MAG: hypothetical protein ACKV0T_24175 [Planctomycetales bacterium]